MTPRPRTTVKAAERRSTVAAPSPALDPPEIADIRRARARIWKEAGGTLRGLYEYMRRVQDELEAGGAEIVRAPQPAKRAKRRRGRAA
jgi:hypothetical protein